MDIVLADTSWKAGVTWLRKIAAICEGFGITYRIHSGFIAPCSIANSHVACSIHNCEFSEVMVPEGLIDSGLQEPLRTDAGGTYVSRKSQACLYEGT